LEADVGAGVLGPVAQIAVLDLLLSGDNAVVIALACRGLPLPLRRRAILLGTGAAVLMRVALALVATLLLHLPWFKIAGGVLLLAIGIDLMRSGASDPHHDAREVERDLWHAVGVIAVADAVMSVDNVVAVAAAARGSAGLLLFGIALSVPILVFASTRLIALFEREPLLVQAGAALLGWVAGDVIVNDPVIADFLQSQSFGLAALAPVLGAAYVLVQGRLAVAAAQPPAATAPAPNATGNAGPPAVAAAQPPAATAPAPNAAAKAGRYSRMDLAILGGVAVPLVGLVLMVLYFVWSAVAPR
jgi:YjbE family integral membrane protein